MFSRGSEVRRTVWSVVWSLMIYAICLTALAGVVVFQPGCQTSGLKARDGVLLPTLKATVGSVEEDARIGIAELDPENMPQALDDLARFSAAIRSDRRSDVVAVAIPLWPLVEAWARSGLDARVASGEFGPGVAESGRVRLAEFGAALGRTIGPVPSVID